MPTLKQVAVVLEVEVPQAEAGEVKVLAVDHAAAGDVQEEVAVVVGQAALVAAALGVVGAAAAVADSEEVVAVAVLAEPQVVKPIPPNPTSVIEFPKPRNLPTPDVVKPFILPSTQSPTHNPLLKTSTTSPSAHAVAMSASSSTLQVPSPRLRTRRRRRASALMLVMAAIVLMSVTIMGVVETMRFSLEENGRASRDFLAMHLAESGIALGLSPQVQPGDPVLRQNIGSDSGFDVVISSEGSRIPLTSLTDENLQNGLYELFLDWGLSPTDARMVVDSLADWVDGDDEPRSQGAEKDYYNSLNYRNFPRNQSFDSLEEMLLVRGMHLIEAAKPNWRDYFSVHGDGFIDINYAPAEVLIAILGAQSSNAELLIRVRSGPDNIPNTEDDVKLTLDQARTILGLEPDRWDSLSNILTDDHLTRRIESTGRIGETTCKLVVIARRQTDGSLNYVARIEE